MSVAPLVGAWIEMTTLGVNSPLQAVAPLVGAWIEMARLRSSGLSDPVAPLVGAWIEITRIKRIVGEDQRRSPRGSVD